MAGEAAQSGDALSQVNEILLNEFGSDENQNANSEDDYVPNTGNAGEQDIDIDDEGDQDQDQDQDANEDQDENQDENQDDSDEDQDEDQDGEDGEETAITNIKELAEHLEADEGEIYSLEVPMGDGMEPVSLSQLKDSYMERERNERQFTERQQQFDEAVRYHQAQWEENQKLPEFNEQVLAAATQVRAIEAADANFDWETLEKENPTAAILQKQKLQAAHDQAVQAYESAKQQLGERRGKAFNDMKAYNRNKTLEAIPDWSDKAKYQKDADTIGNALSEYGFSAQEVANIFDYRLNKVLFDFIRMKEQIDSANVTTKKLNVSKKKRLVGKNSQSRKVGKTVALNKKINAAKTSRDDRVKANAVNDLINANVR